MTGDRDDLRDRLDAVEDTVGRSSSSVESRVVYDAPTGGYVDDEGDPVPTDAAGDPDLPEGWAPIILDGRYAKPDAGDWEVEV